ncbi:hypothetical protein [Macrococcus animalis]|uniref:hypothetical protein n=1 Tax=Macrococcus animalis TaxID=3395467 RepID=UPI0039BDA645
MKSEQLIQNSLKEGAIKHVFIFTKKSKLLEMMRYLDGNHRSYEVKVSPTHKNSFSVVVYKITFDVEERD